MFGWNPIYFGLEWLVVPFVYAYDLVAQAAYSLRRIADTTFKPTGAPPPTLTQNIPFGQSQRLPRVCDNDQEFDTKSKEMYNRFKERDYSSKVLDTALMRASSIDRNSLLYSKPLTAKKGRVFFSTGHSIDAYTIRNIIKKNWNLLQCDDSLNDVSKEPPVFSFRIRPPLGDRPVHSHLPAKKQTTWLPKVPNSTPSHTKFTAKHFINCKTTYAIYLLECSLCDAFYVGRTKQRPQELLAEHRNAPIIGN